MTYPDGDVYISEFKDGSHDGQGAYTAVSCRVDNGIWLKGKFIVVNDVPPNEQTPPVARVVPNLSDSTRLLQAAKAAPQYPFRSKSLTLPMNIYIRNY